MEGVKQLSFQYGYHWLNQRIRHRHWRFSHCLRRFHQRRPERYLRRLPHCLRAPLSALFRVPASALAQKRHHYIVQNVRFDKHVQLSERPRTPSSSRCESPSQHCISSLKDHDNVIARKQSAAEEIKLQQNT